MRQQADKDQSKINQLEGDAEKLQKVIKDADAEKLRQKKELDQVRRPRLLVKRSLRWMIEVLCTVLTLLC